MIIELGKESRDVNIYVNYNGELVLEFKDCENTVKDLITAVVTSKSYSIETLISMLDYDELKDISNYFKTIQ